MILKPLDLIMNEIMAVDVVAISNTHSGPNKHSYSYFDLIMEYSCNSFDYFLSLTLDNVT